ncbi:pseudaminic acid synthase [Agarivorans gilvus]|uniref:Pseudaminic acid synthase n=1 Tax=Agarivorans gilvus TaxID=680279 RepID=A0ABQ1I2N0_9ALTE|nr:pseudaminic acid synthase [Agarivorans gilvus]GGB10478.1 pseudaminic acid synthase [Agarivorans gilvus]
MTNTVYINGRAIGPQHPPYIIAELSANHNGSLANALLSLEVFKSCGADAVKIQSYTADTMTIDCDRPEFKIQGGLWDGYTLYELYKEAHTPFEWHQALFDKAAELELTLFSSPFDESAVDLLESLNAPAYKVASFEATDLPLIAYIAKTGKPLIISTGMASLEEIEEAVSCAKNNGCRELVLLHCISAYPAPVEQANLATIQDLAKRFGCVVGLSDHSLGNIVATTAVSLGAALIEKHVTLDRNQPGPDSAFSLEPHELKELCNQTKLAWQAVGQIDYSRKKSEEANLQFRRSIYFVKEMRAGEKINKKHIRRIRPGLGLEPKFYEQLLGREVVQDIKPGMACAWNLLKPIDS